MRNRNQNAKRERKKKVHVLHRNRSWAKEKEQKLSCQKTGNEVFENEVGGMSMNELRGSG